MDDERRQSGLYPIFGIGIGGFYPQDVNDYIQNEIDAKGYYDTYNTELYMFIELKGGLTYRLKRFDFSGIVEWDLAPKVIMVSGGNGNLNYNFTRVAPTISTNYYFPLGSGKHALFIGGAIHYNILKFKNYSAAAPGYKIQFGSSMQFGRFNLQPYLAYNYATASDNDPIMGNDFELNYTGGQIGVICSFHDLIYFK
jgi:hypothetical protein